MGILGVNMLMVELAGKRKRGRPNRRVMDAVTDDMAVAEVRMQKIGIN